MGEQTEGYDPEWRPEIPEANAVSYPPSGSSRVPDGMPPEKWAMMNRAQRRAYGRKGGKL